MWTFAWRNLLTRPTRTALGLIGLSIPILGVIGLLSVSGGLRNLVGDTLSQIQGVMVLRENAPSPVFSKLKASTAETLRKIPGVRVVAPEVWELSLPIEGVSLIGRTMGDILRPKKKAPSILDQEVIQGQDIPAHQHLRSAVYPRHLLPKEKGGGRFLNLTDRGQPHVVISTKVAENHPRPDGTPRKVGDTLKIGNQTFEIIGLYETGSMFLDVVVIMDIDVARRLLNIDANTVSSFYVEADNPAQVDAVAAAIEQKIPDADARSMSEFQANFSNLLGSFDKFLLMIASLALGVGVVGIVNTMLMSTTERYVEFGVLRTNGWSQGDVLLLVTAESAYLGLLSGLVGCALAMVGAAIANQFITGGLQLTIPLWLYALGIGLALVMGTLGGLYPAWRASRLVPMDAIRRGSQ